MNRFLITLCIVFFTSFVYAASALEELDAFMSPIHQYEARFQQVIRNPEGGILQRSSGRVMIERPNLFRWEVQKPIQQIIIARGNELAIYDPDLEQVILKRLNHVASDAPALLLSRSFKQFSNEFKVSMKIISDTETHFILKPKNQDAVSQFDQVILIFKNRMITGMQLLDQYNHQTVIQFNQVRLNTPFSKSVFRVPSGAGIDVIDSKR